MIDFTDKLCMFINANKAGKTLKEAMDAFNLLLNPTLSHKSTAKVVYELIEADTKLEAILACQTNKDLADLLELERQAEVWRSYCEKAYHGTTIAGNRVIAKLAMFMAYKSAMHCNDITLADLLELKCEQNLNQELRQICQ